MPRKLIWDKYKIDMLKKFLHESNQELAQRFGTTIDMIKKIKYQNGLKKRYFESDF